MVAVLLQWLQGSNGQTEITNINLPNNSYLRPVVNGIGVYSLAKKSDLAGLLLDFEYNNIFVNDSTGYSIKGYDKSYNPIELNQNPVFTFSNSNARYENGKIIGQKEGLVTVTAKIGNISVSKQLRILGDIYSLEISPKTVTVSPNKSQIFSLIAYDKNGYSKVVDNSIATWSVDGIGNINNGTYTAPSTSGTNIVSANISGVRTYSKISVPAKQTVMYDDFESLKGAFSSYPNIITGKVSLSDTCKTGSNSVKLSYNFNTNDTIKGAYYDYSTTLKMPDSVTEIGLWIYNPIKNSNSLKSQYKDANGNTQAAVLAQSLNWTGWKYVTYPSPSSIKGIVSIYVAQNETSTTKTNSYINIDSLYVSYYGVIDSNVVVPSSTSKQDAYNYTNSSSTFNIGIIEEIKTPTTLFDKIKTNKLINQLNENTDLVVFNKNVSDSSIPNNLKCSYISNNGFNRNDDNNCTIITIDASNSGIRNTNFNGWEQLLDNISNTKQNTFIILNNSLDNFSDELEKQLLLDVLIEQKEKVDKNFWIIQKGNVTENKNYNGIKILTIGNDAIPTTDINGNIDNYSYIQIYMDSNNISYDIKNVF